MSDDTRPCEGTRDDGKPCESPFVGADGFCPAHREGGREELRERARKGAEATKRVFRGGGLDPDALPPLTSPEAAERWAELVGRAVTEKRLTHAEGKAVASLLREWRASHEAGAVTEKIRELQALVDQLKGKGNLKVVD